MARYVFICCCAGFFCTGLITLIFFGVGWSTMRYDKVYQYVEAVELWNLNVKNDSQNPAVTIESMSIRFTLKSRNANRKLGVKLTDVAVRVTYDGTVDLGVASLIIPGADSVVQNPKNLTSLRLQPIVVSHLAVSDSGTAQRLRRDVAAGSLSLRLHATVDGAYLRTDESWQTKVFYTRKRHVHADHYCDVNNIPIAGSASNANIDCSWTVD